VVKVQTVPGGGRLAGPWRRARNRLGDRESEGWPMLRVQRASASDFLPKAEHPGGIFLWFFLFFYFCWGGRQLGSGRVRSLRIHESGGVTAKNLKSSRRKKKAQEAQREDSTKIFQNWACLHFWGHFVCSLRPIPAASFFSPAFGGGRALSGVPAPHRHISASPAPPSIGTTGGSGHRRPPLIPGVLPSSAARRQISGKSDLQVQPPLPNQNST